jgi:hypothetical protein
MIKLTNANPNFYKTVLPEEGDDYVLKERKVIYSTLDNLLIGAVGTKSPENQELMESIKESQNLTIYALDLTIVGKISIPEGDIQIYCRKLKILPISDSLGFNVSAKLEDEYIDEDTGMAIPYASQTAVQDNANGEDGDAIATRVNVEGKTKYGKKGKKGGSITLVCDEMNLTADFELTADGAEGYPGCNGQDGGPAPTDNDLVNKGGKGGKGGAPGAGGDSGTIKVVYQSINNSEFLQYSAETGEDGIAGQPGQGGWPRGEWGDAAGLPTDSAVFKEIISKQIDNLSELGEYYDDIFLLKIIQKTKWLYMFNSPTKYVNKKIVYPAGWGLIQDYLGWLQQVLSNYTIVNKQNAKNTKEELASIVSILAGRYSRSVTYFGLMPNQVPVTPIEKMYEIFKEKLKGIKTSEKVFLKLSSEYENNFKEQTALNLAKEAAEDNINLSKARYDFLLGEQKKSSERITDLSIEFNKSKTRLETALTTLKSVVASYYHCSFESIMQAAEMLAFTIGHPAGMAGMGVVEAMNLVNEANTKIEDKENGLIDKQHVVDQIVTLEGDIVNPIKDIFKLDKEGNTTIQPSSKLLLTNIDQLENQIKNIADALSKDNPTVAEDAIRALHSFKEDMIAQGEELLAYNFLAVRLAEEYNTYLKAKTEKVKLDKQADPLSPYSVATVSYYAKLYQDQVEHLMEAAARIKKKYEYVTLDYVQGTDIALSLGSLWLQDSPITLKESDAPDALESIDRMVLDMKEAIVNYNSGQADVKYKFPSKENYRSDIVLKIESKAHLDAFIKDGSFEFEIVPAEQLMLRIDTTPQFHIDSSNFSDIRITHVQPRIIGAKTSSGNLLVKILVRKNSTIKDSEGELYNFLYPINREGSFTYKIESHDKENNEDVGSGSNGILVDEYHDKIGIFTKYKLWLPEPTVGDGSNAINAGLNYKNITGIEIRFAGTRRG